ncbi:transposase [Bacillus sp. 7D3]|nr:transposase [Bacillus amyloliquefaciens]QYM82960.1 transposase [Bacillus sp. 7D3]QZY12198.1 transposase [Bacillus amyloliquefaciens]
MHFLEQCKRSINHQKVITRHVWEDDKEKVRQNVCLFQEKTSAKKIERSFADSKHLQGLRYCRLRGKLNVSEQVLLTAAMPEHEEDCRIPSQARLGMWECFFCT